jgi:hypothetical protein
MAKAEKTRKSIKRAWSKQDFATLRKMAGNELLGNIAKALGRTPGATRQRATQHGISLRMRAKKGGPAKKRSAKKAKK